MHAIHILGQIIFGGYFIFSGYNHFKNHKMLTGYAAAMKVPSPAVAIYGTGIILILGGLGVLFSNLLSSFWVNISLLLIILFLVPVSFQIHAFWKHADTQARMAERINFSKNIALVGAALLLMM